MAQNPDEREPKDTRPPRNPPREAPRDEEPFDVPDRGRDRGGNRERGQYGDRGYRRRPERGGGTRQIVMIALVSLAVVVLANLFYFSPAKTADVNTQFANIAKDIVASKDADKTMQASITTLTNQVSGATSSNAATAQSIAATSSKADSATSQVNTLTSQLATANANISKLQSDLATLQKTPSINPDLQKAVDVGKATDAAMQKQIDDINKKLTANPIGIVPSGTTTPGVVPGGTFYSSTGATNSNAGTSHTLQGVTAMLTNLYGGFNGIPLLTFSVPSPTGGSISIVTGITYSGTGYTQNGTVQIYQANSSNNAMGMITTNGQGGVTGCVLNGGLTGSGYVTGSATLIGSGGNNALAQINATALTAGTATQTVTMTVTNANAILVNNLQLALGLAVVDSNGNPLTTLPTWITPGGNNISVTSGGFGTSWTFQSITSPNIWLFSNVASTNPFGMGAISLQPGQTQTFTQYINVTNSIGGQAGTLYLYPIIRVLSFTG